MSDTRPSKRLIVTASKWGNLYNHRYYIDGCRVGKDEFERTYADLGLTPEMGLPAEDTDYGFRKVWEVRP